MIDILKMLNKVIFLVDDAKFTLQNNFYCEDNSSIEDILYVLSEIEQTVIKIIRER
jgi:hypothetical protein